MCTWLSMSCLVPRAVVTLDACIQPSRPSTLGYLDRRLPCKVICTSHAGRRKMRRRRRYCTVSWRRKLIRLLLCLFIESIVPYFNSNSVRGSGPARSYRTSYYRTTRRPPRDGSSCLHHADHQHRSRVLDPLVLLTPRPTSLCTLTSQDAAVPLHRLTVP